MAHALERDWMVVAPWWRWTDPASVPPGQPVTPDPAAGRRSVPVLQKYDSAALVNDFLAHPQRSLKFNDDDRVHRLRDLPPPTATAAGKWLRMGFSVDPQSRRASAQEYVVDESAMRKVFLTTHKRFYLVVCEIRCDAPGFPRAARDSICRAGFVVRRRTTTRPSADPAAIRPLLTRMAATRMRIARVNQMTEIEAQALAAATGAPTVRSARLDALLKNRTSLQAVLDDDKARFDAWAARLGITWQLQGWFPTPGVDKLGVWAPVDEAPVEPGDEASFPLYPLIPNPADAGHAGNGATVYFGVLPTASHDGDASGTPRFDDNEIYEVRCWVKRHHEPHDADRPCRCPDGWFWSRPSEPYQLASHFDLTGTSHQPVVIQLPKLAELAAQAGKPAFGAGFAKPPGSLMFSVDPDKGKATDSGPSKIPEICFIPIPLITIVATFVLELFLPIVVFVFQLWWMLALRFCIPPQISVSAGIKAELGTEGSFGIALDAKGSLSLDAGVEASLEADLDADLKASFGDAVTAQLQATYAPVALANMDIACNAGDGSMAGVTVPTLNASADFEPEVVRA